MKKLFYFFLASVISVSSFLLVFASGVGLNSPGEMETFNDAEVAENIVHTMTLQRTDPIKVGDEYAWMLISEPGQLAESINALGLGNPNNPNPEMFGDDTSMLFTQDVVNLEQISNKFDLDSNTLLEDNIPITITYSQDDVRNTIPTAIGDMSISSASGGRANISYKSLWC